MVALAFTAFVTPYEIALISTKMSVLFVNNRLVDLVFTIDIIVNFLSFTLLHLLKILLQALLLPLSSGTQWRKHILDTRQQEEGYARPRRSI